MNSKSDLLKIKKPRITKQMDIQGGRGSAPFTEYRVKYFKSIPKEINQDASTVWT